MTEGANMLGAIAGDVIGSVHEGAGTKTKKFPQREMEPVATTMRRLS
jgi:hypothetical protein